MKKNRIYIEVRKSDNEVICLEQKDEKKIQEACAILDCVNTELKLGLKLNLHIEVDDANEKKVKKQMKKWNKLLNG